MMADSLSVPSPGGWDDGPNNTAGSLRIGVNLYPLSLRGGGMRQYVLQLLPWLLRLSPHRLLLFYNLMGQPSLATMLRRLTLAERNRVRTLWIDDQKRIFWHAGDFDVLFCPLNCLAPDLLDRPTLATLADVQERFFPQYFTPEQRQLRGIFYPHTAHASTLLLTLSEFSKQSICDSFAVPADKVRAIHLAPNDEIEDARAEWPAPLGPPPQRYVFYAANLYPHKNHKTLLGALRLLRQRGINCSCLLTGQPAQPGIDIHQEIAAQGLQDRVRWLGHVAPEILRYLYENAIALCFPSEFEGFGMPLIEAMLCGCPVIATPAASIPEIVGDAALLIERSEPAFADAIARLLSDAELRERMKVRGLEHARRFTARRVAEETLQAIAEAVARFQAPRTRAKGTPTVTYVVHPGTGGPALLETLASVAFEVHAHDEVLVLAAPGSLSPQVQALCDNIGVVRFLAPGDASHSWLDEVSNDYLCCVHEGDRLSAGASGAALGVFAEQPKVVAVVGQALTHDGQRLTGVRYLPPRSRTIDPDDPVPSASVFWRRVFLREQHLDLSSDAWPARCLSGATGRIEIVLRTFASVPAASANAYPVEAPRFQRLARAAAGLMVRHLVHFKAPGRAVVGRMPSWLQGRVRRWYRRLVRPYLG